MMGKNSNTKRSKTVVYKCKKKRRDDRRRRWEKMREKMREEGKTLEEKSQVYIIRAYIAC